MSPESLKKKIEKKDFAFIEEQLFKLKSSKEECEKVFF